MSQNIYIRPGGWVSNTIAAVKGSLDLRKFVRDILLTFNVPAYDPFAPSVTAGQPVRVSAGALQTYNGTSWVAAIDVDTSIVVAAPATATSAGVAGTIAYDATHFYVCIATNTWVRTSVATF